MSLLSEITQPTDLRALAPKQLRQVCDELRQALIGEVSKTGGHFSSNLGTVELTVALYAAYEFPPDKIIWDTGHQAYPHKILTGRLDRFGTMRKYKGLSGFLKRGEHELDLFGAGHAGTSISAALGFAEARDQSGGSEKCVAVTGDAAICSGMSWEALNHAGELGTDLHVVLNDNRMSIAPNVGALTSYFTRLRSRPHVQDLAGKLKRAIEQMPDPVTRMAAGLRHGITHYFAPEETGTIFEELGFEYIGPVDGHNVETLYEIFRNAREYKGPLFIHAITVKGKGYDVAEDDSCKWHGVIPFDPDECELPSKAGGALSYTKAFGAAAIECARADDKVVAITAAMPDGTGLVQYAKEFPDRYYDVGIAEQHAVTFAAGLAAGGIKPFCAIYSTFLQRGYDQVLHDVGIQSLPVRFFMDRAGLVGADGPTHHGVFDLSYLSSIPNFVVCAPRDATELMEMARFAKDYDDGPIAVRYPRGETDDRLPEHRPAIQLGRAERLGVIGDGEPEVALLGLGSTVIDCWLAAHKLAERGITTEVVNARWAKPLDRETILELATEVGRLVIVEENVRAGGFGQAVRDLLCEEGYGATPHEIMCVPDRFVDHGSQSELRAEIGLDADAIERRAAELCESAAAR